MKRVHMLSIGAAVQDVFLQGKIFKPKKEDGELVEEFVLGTKNNIEGVTFSTGGGATNASVTFARLGMNSWFMGSLGDDVAAEMVRHDLRKESVNTSLIWEAKDQGTGYSTLLLAPNGERTILTYRGASSDFSITSAKFKSVNPDWIYISSLSGDIEALEAIVEYVKKRKIKIAINPGKGELKQGARFRKLLPHFDILSLNKQELEMLMGTADLNTLMAKVNKDVEYVVVTDGPKGSYVVDRNNLYKSGMYKDVPVIDRTGAGDSFCSGFVAMIARGESVEKAITYGSANSTSVVGKIGAKAGILSTDRGLDSMKITVEELK